MKSSGLTPVTVKNLLIVLLVVSVGAGSSGFVYIQDFIKKYAVDVSHKQIDALASNAALNTLNTTKKDLVQYASIRKKIGNLRATSDFPEFLIVSEVQKIADTNKVAIKTFNYQGVSTTTTTPNQSVGPSTTPNAALQPGLQPTVTPPSGAAKTIALLVDLDNPVDEKAFLQFIHDIEQHLPKMRLSGISVTPVDGSPDKINSGQLTVELYLS